nr:hypothetical protein [Tanacetum cinerariifolium]
MLIFCHLARGLEILIHQRMVGIKVVSEDEEEYEAEFSTRGTVEIEMDRVIEPVVADDIAEPTSEDYHDLVSADESMKDMITDIEVRHRQIKVKSLIASEERAGLLDRITALERSNMRLRDTLSMESADLPIAPKVKAATVASPVEVLERDTHSSSKSGPSKGSLPPVPVAPIVLPFLWDSYKLLLVQVMAALVISISSDVSVESVGSSFP